MTLNNKKIRDYLEKAYSNPKAQAKFALEISGKCVCNCFHCYAEILKKYKDMTVDESQKYLKIAKDVGFDKVYIVGGEPMMHPDIEKICKISHDLGYYTILVTNGYKLDDMTWVEKMSQYIDQFEISIRSDDPLVHNRIISGVAIDSDFMPSESKEGGYEKAMQALVNIAKYKKENNKNYKIIINHDLYTPADHKFDVILNIIKDLYDRGGFTDGLYLQIMQLSGRANQNLDKVYIFKLSKERLLAALENLAKLETDYSIEDLRLVDDPVDLKIMENLEEIPKNLQKYLIIEYIPAVCAGGYKPNVIEDVLFEGSV